MVADEQYWQQLDTQLWSTALLLTKKCEQECYAHNQASISSCFCGETNAQAKSKCDHYTIREQT